MLGGGGAADGPKITTQGGRILYRHRSGMGTVMQFNDGAGRKVIVLDAKYRVNRIFSTLYMDTTTGSVEHAQYNRLHPDSWSNSTPAKARELTDEWINNKMAFDASTSKANCDAWMSQKSGGNSVLAVEWCRSILLEGKTCDLPNIQTLCRIYCEADGIDALDPTIAKYPNRALGSKNTQGAWKIGIAGEGPGSTMSTTCLGRAWSSSHCQQANWLIYDTGNVVHDIAKTHECSVIPVLELA